MAIETLKWFVIFIVALAAQASLVPVIAIAGIEPDLPFLALFLLSLKWGVMAGVYVGFFLGLALDLYSPSILGQAALSKTLIGFFAGLFNQKVMRTDPLLKVALLLIAFLVHDLAFGAVELIKNGHSLTTLFPMILTETLGRAIYTTFFMGLTFVWQFAVASSPLRR